MKLSKIALVLFAAAVVVLIAAFAQANRANPADSLTVTMVESPGNYSNMDGKRVFVLSNSSEQGMSISVTSEVKEPHWPVHGPDRHLQPQTCFSLLPNQATNVVVDIPDGQGVWRLRIDCTEHGTKWQETRLTWYYALKARNLDWLAAQINPTFIGGVIETPEISR